MIKWLKPELGKFKRNTTLKRSCRNCYKARISVFHSHFVLRHIYALSTNICTTALLSRDWYCIVYICMCVHMAINPPAAERFSSRVLRSRAEFAFSLRTVHCEKPMRSVVRREVRLQITYLHCVFCEKESNCGCIINKEELPLCQGRFQLGLHSCVPWALFTMPICGVFRKRVPSAVIK